MALIFATLLEAIATPGGKNGEGQDRTGKDGDTQNEAEDWHSCGRDEGADEG